jgi:hypothetical protein
MTQLEWQIAVGIVIIFGASILTYYSPQQYKSLHKLYKEQIALDDMVIEKLEHSSPVTRFIFRWTTRNVETYFGK